MRNPYSATERPNQVHLSAKEVAAYLHRYGDDIGREYITHKDIWNADKDVVIVGFLHLILDQLREINKTQKEGQRDMMSGWQDWLKLRSDELDGLLSTHAKECKRISKFCDIALLKTDVCALDLHWMSEKFRRSYRKDGDWWEARRYCGLFELRGRVKRLKSVRTINDIENLSLIGKKTAQKIREAMAARHES